MSMGEVLAKCLPPRAKEVIADVIPERDVLLAMAERVAAFEKALAVKKAEKKEEKATKAALKTIGRLRKATAGSKVAKELL